MRDRLVNTTLFGSIDVVTVLIYLVLVVMGWLNIYSAVYNEAHRSIFDISQRYGMQLIWIGISMAIALIILLLDANSFQHLAYPAYWVMMAVLVGVIFFGAEVNGARSWIKVGSIAVQPAEFAKFATALALARYMSEYDFNINRLPKLLRVSGLILLPMVIIVLQNDTGSALVYGAFLIMLYREGLTSWIYWIFWGLIATFLCSFLINDMSLIVILVVVCMAAQALQNRNWRKTVIFLAVTALIVMAAYFGGNMFLKIRVDLYSALVAALALSTVAALIYSYRSKLRNVLYFVLIFWGLLFFSHLVDYTFDNILQTHQQKRILDLLGLEEDLKGWGYNLNQSKITIGSGGWLGKGFLNGTQTKFNFVPEQSTDFIFCTVGEEWGFAGSIVVVGLFFTLILRIMRMGERQNSAFGRIYCYSVASIFLAHVVINTGMTIGLFPVVGIPLPFFSYGGSSMIAFTILLFTAIKLDAGRRESHNI